MIPLYNKGRQIVRAIDSIVSQKFPSYEIIVVNDGSSDDGPLLVEGLNNDSIRLLHQSNQGPGAARNSGLAIAKGEYIVFFDADDELLPGSLSTMYSAIFESKCNLAVFQHYRVCQLKELFTCGATGIWQIERGICPATLKNILDSFCAGAVICKRDTCLKYGGFFEKFTNYGEDSFFWLKVILNETIFFQALPTVVYHTENSKLGVGRNRPYPIPPILTHASDLFNFCPQKLLYTLKKFIDYYAIFFCKRSLEHCDVQTCLLILKRFPYTKCYVKEYMEMKVKAGYPFLYALLRKFLRRKDARLNIIHLPYYTDNPYQRLLIDSLSTSDIKIFTDQSAKIRLKFIINNQIDVVHLHWLHPFFLRKNLLNSLIAVVSYIIKISFLRIFGVKIVWTVHNLHNHKKLYMKIDYLVSRFTAVMANHLIALSEFNKNSINKFFNIKNGKISVIPHGNYIDVYKSSGLNIRQAFLIPDDSVVFLFFGRICGYKGIHSLIDAVKCTDSGSCFLIVAGKPETEILKDEINLMCQSLNNVRLNLQFISPIAVRDYFDASDYFVIPYDELFSSGSLILGMSMGKTVIAPAKGSVLEYIHNEGAILYGDNPRTLHEAIKLALSKSKSEIRYMGEQNQKAARGIRWSNIAKQTLCVYKNSHT